MHQLFTRWSDHDLWINQEYKKTNIRKKQHRQFALNSFVSLKQQSTRKSLVSITMANKDSFQNNTRNGHGFKIKNNILIGDELVYPEKSLNAGEIILGIFKSKPEHVGQVEVPTGRQSTYGEMWERSVRCAIWLKKQGVQRGDTIACCCDNVLDAYVPFVASLCIGSIFAPDIPDQNLFIARRHLTTTKPKVIFLHADSAPIVEEIAKELNMKLKIILVDDTSDVHETLDDILAQQSATDVEIFRCEPIEDPKQTAIFLKTSGTTGPPKYAELSYLGMKTLLHPTRSRDVANTVAMCCAELSWLYGVIETMKAIRGFARRVVFVDDDSMETCCKFIDAYKVEYFSMDTNMAMSLIKTDLLKRYSLGSLKILVIGGTCFKREHHETLMKLLPHVRIFQIYGSTDAGDGYIQQNKNCKPGSCGFILPGVQVRIANCETRESLGPNERGEICVFAPTVLTRYFKNPQATKQVLDSDGWLRTGDIGYYDEDGEIYVVDRISQFIKYKSNCLSPAEIEAALERHPAVYEAAVIPIPHDVDGERPLAIVCKQVDKEVTAKELQDFVQQYLPEYYKLCGGVKFMDKLPRTNTGKITKHKLKEMYRDGSI